MQDNDINAPNMKVDGRWCKMDYMDTKVLWGPSEKQYLHLAILPGPNESQSWVNAAFSLKEEWSIPLGLCP